MPLLTRKKQLTVVVQRTDALPSGLDNAANAQIVALEATANPDVERIERNVIRTTISAVKDTPGQRAIQFEYGVEMNGTKSGTAEPPWMNLLRGCGFKVEAISAISIGAISAGGAGSTTFRHGEIVTGGTSSATGRVVMDTHNGTAQIYIDTSSVTGTFASGEVLTGSDSGATATTSSVAANEGFGAWPISVVEKAILFDATGLTTALSPGDLIEGTSSGARGVVTQAAAVSANTQVFYTPVRGSFTGSEQMARLSPSAVADIGSLNAATGEAFTLAPPLGMKLRTDGKALTGIGVRGSVVFNFEVNRPARMDFTFRGQLNSTVDAPLLTGIDYENRQPPNWESSAIGFARNDDPASRDVASEIEPCLNSMSVDLGAALTDRRCAGAPTGLLEIFNTEREATGSMDPEDTLEADIPWLGYVQDGNVARLKWTLGATNGNRFTLQMPGIQFTQSAEGDRESIVTQDMTFRVTGGDLFDLQSATNVSSIGGDNELVIVYHTA